MDKELCIPIGELITEHKRIAKVLNRRKGMAAEAKKQEAELKEYEKKASFIAGFEKAAEEKSKSKLKTMLGGIVGGAAGAYLAGRGHASVAKNLTGRAARVAQKMEKHVPQAVARAKRSIDRAIDMNPGEPWKAMEQAHKLERGLAEKVMYRGAMADKASRQAQKIKSTADKLRVGGGLAGAAIGGLSAHSLQGKKENQ